MVRAFEARWDALPGALRGITWMLIGAAAFSISSVLVKLVGARIGTIEISFFRCLFGILVLLPFLVRNGWGLFHTRHAWLHFSRSGIGVFAMMASFYSVANLPLATASAISFSKPLFVTVLSAVMLHEVVRWRRWTATILGFVGVLVIARPTPEGVDLAALVGLASAGLIALVALLIKTMTATERPITILAWSSVGTTLLLAGPAALTWVQPTPVELALLLGLGITSAAGQGWLIKAYQAAEASLVAPFDYSRLLFATAFGYLIFAELPDATSLVGAAIVIGSSVYIARREARLGAQRRVPPVA